MMRPEHDQAHRSGGTRRYPQNDQTRRWETSTRPARERQAYLAVLDYRVARTALTVPRTGVDRVLVHVGTRGRQKGPFGRDDPQNHRRHMALGCIQRTSGLDLRVGRAGSGSRGGGSHG